jgi:hypothetical protein
LADRLCVRRHAALALAVYPPFLFFSALINKDIFLIFLLLRLTRAMIERRWAMFAMLGLLLGLVRIQYLALPLIALFLAGGRFRHRFWLAYVVTALLAGAIVRFTGVFDIDRAQSGLSDLVYAMNQRYLIGSLVFNPLRIVQYPLSLAQGWTLVFREDGLDLMKLTEGITFFWFLLVVPGVVRFFRRFPAHRDHRGATALRAVIVAYVFVLLLTQITEPRYLMSLFPLLLLAAAPGVRRVAPVPKPISSSTRSAGAAPATA